MSADFTTDDINEAADLAWAAIHRYAKRKDVCTGCLGAQVVRDMLYSTVKNNVADTAIADYRAAIDEAWTAAIAARDDNNQTRH